MTGKFSCTLCGAEAVFLLSFRSRDYYRCRSCRSVMMDPAFHLTPAEEKKRYDQHNNDLNDPGYRQFVDPLVKIILEKQLPGETGLDYGAGPGPVAAHLLETRGYRLELYDPFYWKNRQVFQKEFNYVILCEVIEHFYRPALEFARLRSLLLPGGSLYCMTELLDNGTDFENWYYKNDPTHVFFYHREALNRIGERFGFSGVFATDRLIHFAL